MIPPCTEVVAAMDDTFKDWTNLGHLKNFGVTVRLFKKEDTGDGATYVRVMHTPNLADVQWGVNMGWKPEQGGTCLEGGTIYYSLVLVTKRRERV